MNKKNVLQAAAVACAALVIFAIFFLRPKSAEITLINAAQESLIHTTVEINGAKFEFDDIPTDGFRRIKYKAQADNHYTVTVEFHYERKLGPDKGYFSGQVK